MGNMSKNFFSLILSDLKAALDRDPAARNYLEIFFTYSGFHAIFGYRLSHILWNSKLKFLARFLSNIVRVITAIEIHPSVKIGKGFFIDHGAGLVIGETSQLGNNITMYQQVTLGGISPSLESKTQRNVKRHPTLSDGVIVGSGAQILGPINIGLNSRIGANAVVLKDVPPNQTFIGIPARKVRNTKEKNNFDAYGMTEGNIDDPNKKSIVGLLNEIYSLTSKLEKLEKKLHELKIKDKPIKTIMTSNLKDNKNHREK